MRNLFILFLCSCSLMAFGQNQPWTLEKCINYAMENNLQIRLNQLTIESNKEAVILAEHARYPSLNGQASHNYNWGLSFDVLTNQPVNRRVQSNGFSVGGNVTLYNDFRLRNQIQQAELNLKASNFDLDQTKNLTALNIVGAYVQIIFNTENLNNAKRQVNTLQEQIDRTKKLVDAGVLPKSNLLDLQSQLATNELQVVQSENALAFSKLQLKQLLQLTDDGPIEIVIPTVPDPDATVVLAKSSEVYSTAVDNQPDVKSADVAIESADLGIRIAESGYKPTLSMSYGLSTSYSSAQNNQLTGFTGTALDTVGFTNTLSGDPVVNLTVDRNTAVFSKFGFFDQIDEGFNKNLRFSLTIPIYNRNQVKNSVAVARIQKERAKLQAETVRNNLRQTIEQAYQDALAASKTYSANKKQVEALEETFRMTQERFNSGVSNITDFNVAQNNLNVAKSNLIRAKYDYVLKVKILDFYMGKDLTSLE